MTVGLPPDTMKEYADRIFSRFPRLFLALGCPALQSEFDLQPVDGAKVVVAETAACMLVEMRLPRRNRVRPGPEPLTLEEGASEGDSLSPFSKARGRPESVSSQESLSPFSTSRKLVGAFARSVLGGRDRCGVRRPAARAARAAGVAEHSGISSNEEPTLAARLAEQGVAPPPKPMVQPSPELPILLSAASLARLSTARRQHVAEGPDCVDPGKPMLSFPGSHDPWGASEAAAAAAAGSAKAAPGPAFRLIDAGSCAGSKAAADS